MIIDSHAHYSRFNFDFGFRYLSYQDGDYQVKEGNREAVIHDLKNHGIAAVIEPAVEFKGIEKLLAFSKENPGYVFPAVGVHPTRTGAVKLRDKKALRTFANDPDVIAIGEAGLDFHLEQKQKRSGSKDQPKSKKQTEANLKPIRKSPPRLRQYFWFKFQIELANQHGLPLVLHIRSAYPEAIKVLKRNKKKLHGGVAHCFCGTAEDARDLVDLGFYLGIGGALLQQKEKTLQLQEAVRTTPLERILVETDAPFVYPDLPEYVLSKKQKQKQKVRNTSLILPCVLRRISEIKNIDVDTVESVVFENTLKCFRLTPDFQKTE